MIKPEENFSPEIICISETIRTWQNLRKHKVPEKDISRITKISRATFYRYQKQVRTYGLKGLEKKSKRPKTFRKSKIPIETINTILSIRRENPTYGKFKIAIILQRDYAISISESSVGRVLQKLKTEGKITKSVSSCKAKRKRKFTGPALRGGNMV